MVYLVTGALSGLGRYAHERLGGAALTRASGPADWRRLRESGVDVVFHCAATAVRGADQDSLRRSVEDNVLLTERLLSIPHRKFILMSSADVYPKDGRRHREDEDLSADAAAGLYALTKLMSEALVRKAGPGHLILRAASLLGPYSRPNALTRLLDDEPLGLSAESRLNFVLHSDLLDFVQAAVERGLAGTYNAAASAGVTLGEAARRLGKSPRFGSFRYDVGDVDNSKISAVWPAFRRTSLEVAEEYARQRSGARAS